MKNDWQLTCLICGHTGENNLVEMQEHAMAQHGYKQEHHRHVSKRQVEDGFIWTMPDGRDWLKAQHAAIRKS